MVITPSVSNSMEPISGMYLTGVSDVLPHLVGTDAATYTPTMSDTASVPVAVRPVDAVPGLQQFGAIADWSQSTRWVVVDNADRILVVCVHRSAVVEHALAGLSGISVGSAGVGGTYVSPGDDGGPPTHRSGAIASQTLAPSPALGSAEQAAEL